MKKAILTIFKGQVDDEQKEAVKNLAVSVASWNLGTKQDIVNKIHNDCPYQFLCFNHNDYIDVHFRDETKRAGMIQLVKV